VAINQPNLEGQVQDPSGHVSDNTIGGPGSVNLLNVTTSGGLTGRKGAVLFFGDSAFSLKPLVWFADLTNFNCEDDVEYHFRIEEVEVYRQPTVDKIIFRYRDFGKVTVTCFISGNVLQESAISKFVTVVFGGKADGKIYTTSFDLTCTFEAPQLIITRQGGSGPMALTKVMMELVHGDAKPQ